MHVLKNKNLWRSTGFINGKWVQVLSASREDTFDVVNPATGELLAILPRMGVADTEKAIQAAGDSWANWKSTTGHERSKFLTRMADLVDKYR